MTTSSLLIILYLQYLYDSVLIRNFYLLLQQLILHNSCGNLKKRKIQWGRTNCLPIHMPVLFLRFLTMFLLICWITTDDRAAFAGNVGEVADVHKRCVPTLRSLLGRYSNAGDRIHLPTQHPTYIFADYVDQIFSGFVFNSCVHTLVFLKEILPLV